MTTKAQNLPCFWNTEVCFSFSAVRLWGYFLPGFSLQDAHTHTYTHTHTNFLHRYLSLIHQAIIINVDIYYLWLIFFYAFKIARV